MKHTTSLTYEIQVLDHPRQRMRAQDVSRLQIERDKWWKGLITLDDFAIEVNAVYQTYHPDAYRENVTLYVTEEQ